jgi:superfamily II DNA helicase RecQ
LRKNIADSEGVPVYTVFTNEQLAEIVRQKITTKNALSGIQGVGGKKIEKYGDNFIPASQKNQRP